MMLSLENRESNDKRFLGENLLYFTDDMSDNYMDTGFSTDDSDVQDNAC